MKAYKGFNKDMTCRGFQYEEGKTYEEDNAELCNTGFHACESPLDCFEYYPPGTSVYHEVDLNEASPEKSRDTKRVGKKIKIKANMGIKDLINAHFEFVKSNIKETTQNGESNTATVGNYGTATVGNRGTAIAGDSGAAIAGNYGTATVGDRGTAIAGYSGAAIAGYRGTAIAGDSGAAIAGDYGTATVGNCGAAIAGDSGTATSRGSSATGNHGLSVARGSDVKVKGGLNAILVIAKECDNNSIIKHFNSTIVDGEKIKADTWYRLDDDGEFKECEDQS